MSREVVVQTAAQVADELGWENFTLAVVAERLGVRLPSLYKHVEGLDHLRHHLALLAINELTAAMSHAAVGRARTEALQAIADAYLAYGREHPGCYAAVIRAPDPKDKELRAAAEALLRVVFAVLAGYGLRGDDAVDATRALRATLHGFVALEAGGGFGMPREVNKSYRRFIAGFDELLAGWGRPKARGSSGARGH